mgnify:FL=1
MQVAEIWQPKAQQRMFRELLQAMARPGTVVDLEPFLDGDDALAGVLATLVDGAVTLADPDGLLSEGLWNFTQATPAASEAAGYVACAGRAAPSFEPCLGDLKNPERGATLIVAVERVGDGPCRWSLSGPGIQSSSTLALAGLASAWFDRRREWNAHFPLGVDMFFCAGPRVAALPRTTIAKLEE